MQYKKTILLIEDDKKTVELLTALLTDHDYRVICTALGREALSVWKSHHPDLILLDPDLSDMDGMEILRDIHTQSEVPVIILSASQDEYQKVRALRSGAIDYITKPFGRLELLARIQNMIRLYERLAGASSHQEVDYQSGGFYINYAFYRVSVDGLPIHLTPIEYRIVEFLSRHAGRVLTHEQIINHVWGPNNCDSQVLRVNMANIRRKIERDPATPEILLTEVGVGYRLGSPPGEAEAAWEKA